MQRVRKDIFPVLRLMLGLILLLSAMPRGISQTCYEKIGDFSGFVAVNDSIEPISCQIAGLFPVALADSFGVYSASEYDLISYYGAAYAETQWQRMLDSVAGSTPYYLFYRWKAASDGFLDDCEVWLSLPGKTDFFECQTPLLRDLVRASIQARVDSFTTSDYYGPDLYLDAEVAGLRLLRETLREWQVCCAGLNKTVCSICVPEDKIGLFKADMGLVRLPESISATASQYQAFQAARDTTIQGNRVTDYVKSSLEFATGTLDLYQLFEDFSTTVGSGLDYRFIHSADDQFCMTDPFAAEEANLTIINISPEAAGYRVEWSEKIAPESPSFLEFVVSRHDEIFGPLLDLTNRATLGVDFVVVPQAAKCVYTPSGALFRVNHPSISNAELYDTAFVKYGYPINTLRSFSNEDSLYNGIFLKHFPNFKDYYLDSGIDDYLRRHGKLSTSNLVKDIPHFAGRSEYLVPIGESCTVSAYLWEMCGTRVCTWTATAEYASFPGLIREVVIPADADCSTIKNITVCCPAGQAYVRRELDNPGLSEADKAEIRTIGGLLCELGEALFDDYQADDWGELPDMLRLYYEVNRERYLENCSNCQLKDFTTVVREYVDTLRGRIAQIAQQDTWVKMRELLDEFSDAEIGALDSQTRLTAIRTLTQKLDNAVAFGGAEKNEQLIVRLLEHIEDDRKCAFAQLLLNDAALLETLFSGFDDISFWEGGQDEYLAMIEVMIELVKDCGLLHTDVNNPQLSVTRLVRLAPRTYMGNYGQELSCEVELESECFEKVKLKSPFREKYYHPVNNEEKYRCGIPDEWEEISFTNPLEKVVIELGPNNPLGLAAGWHEMPAFLLCYLADDQQNQIARDAISTIITTAVVAVSIQGVVASSGVWFYISLVDLTLVTTSLAMNEYIETNALRSFFDSDADYDQFVNAYRQLETVLNYAVITASAAVALRQAVKNANRAWGKRNPNVSGNSASQQADQYFDDILNSPFIYLLWEDFPRVKQFAEEFSDLAIRKQLVQLDDDYLRALNDDLAHDKWGSEITQLFVENPTDIKDIWQKLKDDPSLRWEIFDDGAGFEAGSRWDKWSKREFFKSITQKGKDFEDIVTGIAKNGSRSPFDVWLNDGFTHHSQLHIENLTGGKKIIGDDVFVKNDIDDFGVSFKRAIFHDSKLSSGSPWTPNQRSELIDIFSNNPNMQYVEFEVRTANNKLPQGSPVSQGQNIRVYREDVFKTISNVSGNIASTNQVF